MRSTRAHITTQPATDLPPLLGTCLARYSDTQQEGVSCGERQVRAMIVRGRWTTWRRMQRPTVIEAAA